MGRPLYSILSYAIRNLLVVRTRRFGGLALKGLAQISYVTWCEARTASGSSLRRTPRRWRRRWAAWWWTSSGGRRWRCLGWPRRTPSPPADLERVTSRNHPITSELRRLVDKLTSLLKGWHIIENWTLVLTPRHYKGQFHHFFVFHRLKYHLIHVEIIINSKSHLISRGKKKGKRCFSTPANIIICWKFPLILCLLPRLRRKDSG